MREGVRRREKATDGGLQLAVDDGADDAEVEQRAVAQDDVAELRGEADPHRIGHRVDDGAAPQRVDD